MRVAVMARVVLSAGLLVRPSVGAGYLGASEANLQIGARLEVSSLFTFGGAATYRVTCVTTPNGADCGSSVRESEDFMGEDAWDVRIEPVRHDYARYGAYEAVANGGGTAVLTNVFRDARPVAVDLPQGPLLLWTHQNPALPPLQSTDIAWKTAYGPPSIVSADTRVELAPVAAADRFGGIVAAWLRVKDPAFAAPVARAEDLPRFFAQFEVVSAVFDPAARRWSPVTALTDDAAIDRDLRLSRDPAGNLMLTWIRTDAAADGGEGLSDIRASFWNGSAWSAPATIASNVAGLTAHAAPLYGNTAFVIASRDPVDVPAAPLFSDSSRMPPDGSGSSARPAKSVARTFSRSTTGAAPASIA